MRRTGKRPPPATGTAGRGGGSITYRGSMGKAPAIGKDGFMVPRLPDPRPGPRRPGHSPASPHARDQSAHLLLGEGTQRLGLHVAQRTELEHPAGHGLLRPLKYGDEIMGAQGPPDAFDLDPLGFGHGLEGLRSEEHTSELQS